MDDTDVSSRLAQMAELPLEQRAALLEGLIDELESALEETSLTDGEAGD